MKVAHLVPAMNEGGVETVVVALNRELVKNGWESVVIADGGRLFPIIERDGGKAVRLPLKSKNPFSYFKRAFQLRANLRRERPDLVCVHSRVPAWLFVLANRTLQIPWITYAHGANSISAYSKVMTYGDRVVTPSNFLADYLIKAYDIASAKIRVIANAVDATRFDPTAVRGEVVSALRRQWKVAGQRVVMAVGRITPVKGLATLIRAMASVPATLVIVGDADRDHCEYREGLKRLAAGLGCADRVVFAGSRTDIPECLQLSDVIVSANTTKPESFGLSMAEALMMGKPVVAQAFGGALDIVREGLDGRLIPPASLGTDPAKGFASVISEVLSHPWDAAAIRQSALARFSTSAMIKSTLALYTEVIGAEVSYGSNVSIATSR